jgi:choline dehydrogenase
VLRARREVVLSAGAVGTPQLLMLSGIGDGEALRALGIPVAVHNPQRGAAPERPPGDQLHLADAPAHLQRPAQALVGQGLAGRALDRHGRGPLSLSVNHGGGFFRTEPGLSRPNMQLYIQAFSTLIPREGERPILSQTRFPACRWACRTAGPRAGGGSRLRSPDPLAPPRITANAYGTDEDVREMLAGVRMLRRIAAEAPFAEVVKEELRPGPEVASEAALVHDIRARSGTVYHPCGTARMGPDATSAVVDARLRVHGVRGLRVADASVFPTLPGGNTNAPATLVGWRAGEFLREARL